MRQSSDLITSEEQADGEDQSPGSFVMWFIHDRTRTAFGSFLLLKTLNPPLESLKCGVLSVAGHSQYFRACSW